MLDREEVLSSFEPAAINGRIFRLWVRGRYVRTTSNKTVWCSLGAIKNAIRNHIWNWSGTDGDRKVFVASLPVVPEGAQQDLDIAIVELKS